MRSEAKTPSAAIQELSLGIGPFCDMIPTLMNRSQSGVAIQRNTAVGGREYGPEFL